MDPQVEPVEQPTHERNKSQVLDEVNIDNISFEFSKHRKGWANRMFHMGDAQDERALLTFKKSVIKKALLKSNREMDEEAIQFFKNIMSYMGDRDSSKDGANHARKIIDNGLHAPATLKDELFLQIIKQVTDHPVLANCTKGWQLFHLILGSFGPSDDLKPFVIEYLDKTLNDPASPMPIRLWATSCELRIPIIMEIGSRTSPPSLDEINCDMTNDKVPIKVITPGGSSIVVPTGPYDKISEFKESIIKSLGLSYIKPFALFKITKLEDDEPPMEEIIDDSHRVLSLLGDWHVFVDGLKNKKFAKKFPIDFVYKSEFPLKTNNKEMMKDPVAFELTYSQAWEDVMTQRYPAVAKEFPQLAALQLQIKNGDCDEKIHTSKWISDALQDILPPSAFGELTGKPLKEFKLELAEKVHAKYAKLVGTSKQDSKQLVLEYIQAWDMYGATYITVGQKQIKGYPPKILFAVTPQAVYLVNSARGVVLDKFLFAELVTWEASDEKLTLIMGTAVHQRKLFLETKQGAYINRLMDDYSIHIKEELKKKTKK